MDVEVVRSPRRRKTVSARLVGGVVHVSIPARMSKAEEQRCVAEMVAHFERRRAAEPIDLAARAEVLAARHGLPQAASVRWVDNQVWRWGSCTPEDRSIRLSTRLAGFPPWVVDAVLVHELCHLVVAGHGADFWALANRYPRMERARGFLIAKGLDDGDGTAADGGPGSARPGVPRWPAGSRVAAEKAGQRGRRPPEVRGEQPTLW